MRFSTIVIIISMIAGISVLVGLGSWQVKRLYWKEALIAKVEEKKAKPPIELDEFLAKQPSKEEWPYTPVTTKGIYDHSNEIYFFTTSIDGKSGWNINTPMLLENGKYLIVNRGFVPYEMRNPELRLEGQVKGEQELTGLLRVPVAEKPNSFFPENIPKKREIYWRDIELMSKLMGKDNGREFVSFFVDANDAPNPGGFPRGGSTIITFSNSHLQYAVTWYGLALALLGVGGFFLYSRRQKND